MGGSCQPPGSFDHYFVCRAGLQLSSFSGCAFGVWKLSNQKTVGGGEGAREGDKTDRLGK